MVSHKLSFSCCSYNPKWERVKEENHEQTLPSNAMQIVTTTSIKFWCLIDVVERSYIEANVKFWHSKSPMTNNKLNNTCLFFCWTACKKKSLIFKIHHHFPIWHSDTNILMTGSDSIDSDLLSYPWHRIKIQSITRRWTCEALIILCA